MSLWLVALLLIVIIVFIWWLFTPSKDTNYPSSDWDFIGTFWKDF